MPNLQVAELNNLKQQFIFIFADQPFLFAGFDEFSVSKMYRDFHFCVRQLCFSGFFTFVPRGLVFSIKTIDSEVVISDYRENGEGHSCLADPGPAGRKPVQDLKTELLIPLKI